MHVAAFYDSEWDELLIAGADIHLQDVEGRRAIDIAKTMAPRMGYVEARSIAPQWLSPHTDHRKLLALLEKMDTGFEIDRQVWWPSSECSGVACGEAHEWCNRCASDCATSHRRYNSIAQKAKQRLKQV